MAPSHDEHVQPSKCSAVQSAQTDSSDLRESEWPTPSDATAKNLRNISAPTQIVTCAARWAQCTHEGRHLPKNKGGHQVKKTRNLIPNADPSMAPDQIERMNFLRSKLNIPFGVNAVVCKGCWDKGNRLFKEAQCSSQAERTPRPASESPAPESEIPKSYCHYHNHTTSLVSAGACC